MNWLKAVFNIILKINKIIDILIMVLENWEEKTPTPNVKLTVTELKGLKK